MTGTLKSGKEQSRAVANEQAEKEWYGQRNGGVAGEPKLAPALDAPFGGRCVREYNVVLSVVCR